jgi:hypothetical protein
VLVKWRKVWQKGIFRAMNMGDPQPSTTQNEPNLEKGGANSTPELSERFEAKRELLLNTLNQFVRGRKAQTPLERLFVLDAFNFMGEEIPEKEAIINEFNNTQSADGTWKTGHEHYVPTTAQAFMCFKRIGATPEKSLEPFLATINTWEKVIAHNEKYQPGNYWGGLWGYVGCYTAVGQRPPWTEQFLEEVNERFDDWAFDNHQRSHTIDCLRQLKEPIPRVEELIALTLKDQKPDGRWTAEDWNPAVPQTAFGIATLKLLEKQGSPETNEAIERGLAFIDQCFKTVRWKGKEYGGYASEPEDPFPDALATSVAILAQLHPEKLDELM